MSRLADIIYNAELAAEQRGIAKGLRMAARIAQAKVCPEACTHQRCGAARALARDYRAKATLLRADDAGGTDTRRR